MILARLAAGYALPTAMALAMTLAMTLGASAQADTLYLGVHPEEPAPTLGHLLAQMGTEADALEVREYRSQTEMIAALQAGELDSALLEAPPKNIPGVHLIADLYPSVLHILYRKTSNAKDLPALLTSGLIWAGGDGSIGAQLVNGLIRDYGIDPAQVRFAPDPISATPDVWVVFGGILNADALSRLEAFELFSLGEVGAQGAGNIAEGIALRYPTLHTMELPSQLYPMLGGAAMTTLAVNTQLVVREEISTDSAYQLAELVEHAKPLLAATYPFVSLEEKISNRLGSRTLALHPGAQRFEDRHEPSFLERYAEVFAFLLTALVALASATVALRRYRDQRRKDRLDSFFERLLQMRGTDISAMQNATAIRNLQAEVIDLVVAERIGADGALLAFLTLSNQLLSEAQTNQPSS